MPIIYITGPTGSGKSTISNRLRELGYIAYDADSDLCSWFENETGKEVEYPKDHASRPHNWQDMHTFLMSESKVQEIFSSSRNSLTFICGIAPNDLVLAKKYFAKVFLLMIDEKTMLDRVESRTNNDYGKAEDQKVVITKWYEPTIEKYKNYGATVINAELPEQEIINLILDEVKESVAE